MANVLVPRLCVFPHNLGGAQSAQPASEPGMANTSGMEAGSERGPRDAIARQAGFRKSVKNVPRAKPKFTKQNQFESQTVQLTVALR